MEISIHKAKNVVLSLIQDEIKNDRKYFENGYKINGYIKNDKIYLKLDDEYNRHSKFLTEVFYGKILNNNDVTVIKGNFRITNYILILLIILFVVSVESIVASIIVHGLTTDVLLPVLIILAEIIYLFLLKSVSKTTNNIIKKYINSI